MNEVLAAWDCRASVEKVRAVVIRWKSVTIEMLTELWRAREELSKPGRPETGADAPVMTWADYCEEVGLSKSTVNRWLSRYDPQTQKLLAPPEPAEIITQYNAMNADQLLAEMARETARVRFAQDDRYRPPQGLYARWGELMESADIDTILALASADMALEDAVLNERWAATDPVGFAEYLIERASYFSRFHVAICLEITERVGELPERERISTLLRLAQSVREWGELWFEVRMKIGAA